MLKWLHRYFTTRHHQVHGVKVEIGLQVEEYPRGIFRFYIKEPGDLSFHPTSYDDEAVPHIHPGDGCGEWLERVQWNDVTIEYGWCKAPSIERLEKALSHVTFGASYRSNR
jgi:hypothetical protein